MNLEKNENAKVEFEMSFIERHYKELVIFTSIGLGILMGMAFIIFLLNIGFWSGIALAFFAAYFVYQLI